MTGAQRGDFERPASPQPSNRDEPVDLMGRLRASIDQARADRAAAAADQPGAGGEADECPHNEDRASCAVGCGDAPPAPSAGQDTERLRDELVSALRADVLNVSSPGWAERVADEILPVVWGGVQALAAQRDEARAQVQRVERVVDKWQSRDDWLINDVRRALDGQP